MTKRNTFNSLRDVLGSLKMALNHEDTLQADEGKRRAAVEPEPIAAPPARGKRRASLWHLSTAELDRMAETAPPDVVKQIRTVQASRSRANRPEAVEPVVARQDARRTRQASAREDARDYEEMAPQVGLDLPESPDLRRLYLTVLALAQIGLDEGYTLSSGKQVKSARVVFWAIRDAMKPEMGTDDVYQGLDALTRQGLLIQRMSGSGNMGWIPAVLDSGEPGRGARSARGGRSSAIRRAVDALEDRFNRR